MICGLSTKFGPNHGNLGDTRLEEAIKNISPCRLRWGQDIIKVDLRDDLKNPLPGPNYNGRKILIYLCLRLLMAGLTVIPKLQSLGRIMN